FPEPFETLRPALERAARQGGVVAGVTYAPTADGPPPFIVARGAAHIARRWPGRQAMIVADACEHLAALPSRDGTSVLRGTWSDSAWLACIYHNGLACEIRL